MSDRPPRFVCDAMLGGLARWLRAAGYDAAFEPRIDDGELVARAVASGEVLLSSDAPLFRRKPVRDGAARALFVPRHAPPLDQAAFVLRALALPRRDPRCMACGGGLAPRARDDVAARVPSRTLAAFDRFWSCDRCDRVYWHGTHWARIDAQLASIAARSSSSSTASPTRAPPPRASPRARPSRARAPRG